MLNDLLTNMQHGIHHVLSLGAYDHILFLILLSIPYLFKDWKRVLLLVTVFTVGHTVSLVLAAYHVISINTNLIEFLIPITILIVALYNVFTSGKKTQHQKRNLLFFATLFFGLIHGLGFLKTFESLINASKNKLITLLEISLGMEIGQLILAFIVLFFGMLCQTIFRFSRRDWIMVISAIVIGLAIPMLVNTAAFS